jgi:hypothetical protein
VGSKRDGVGSKRSVTVDILGQHCKSLRWCEMNLGPFLRPFRLSTRQGF